jgi:D-glycero-D-manno-heptose 1,7-bisphosphate phosphatase
MTMILRFLEGYNSRMFPAIFLDRDGVLIENRSDYVKSWGDVMIIPQAKLALSQLKTSPYLIIIVTNQSAIGRGIVSSQVADEINNRLIIEIEKAGGRIDGIFMCPHIPEDLCACRKPHPGLILEAAKTFSIKLSQSILIGDALTDLQAGLNAGVGRIALVRTGRGAQQAKSPHIKDMKPFPIFDAVDQAIASMVGPSNCEKST